MKPRNDERKTAPSDNPSLSNTNASSRAREMQHTFGDTNKQKKWLHQSKSVINHFLAKLELDEFKSFSDVVSWMGHQRCVIAIKLMQGYSDKQYKKMNFLSYLKNKYSLAKVSKNSAWYLTTDELEGPLLFGKPKGFTKSAILQKETLYEILPENQRDWVSPAQRKAIFTILKKLVNCPYVDGVYEDANFICKKDPDNKNCYLIEYKSSLYKKPILEIYFDNTPDYGMIRFIHPVVSQAEQEMHLKELDTYYQRLVLWNPEQGIDAFFNDMAKLIHLSACLPYYDRGTSSVVEWLMHSLAYKKGIYLGPFNAEMGWDFKAFCTPNVEEYAKWLQTKGFSNISYFDANTRENIAMGFSYVKRPNPTSNPVPLKMSSDDPIKKEWLMTLSDELSAHIEDLKHRLPKDPKNKVIEQKIRALKEVGRELRVLFFKSDESDEALSHLLSQYGGPNSMINQFDSITGIRSVGKFFASVKQASSSDSSTRTQTSLLLKKVGAGLLTNKGHKHEKT